MGPFNIIKSYRKIWAYNRLVKLPNVIDLGSKKCEWTTEGDSDKN